MFSCPADVYHVRPGLRIPHFRQRLLGPPTGYQASPEGQAKRSADTTTELPPALQDNARTTPHIRH